MCDLYIVTSSLAVFEAAIWVKSMHLMNHAWKPEKRRKYGNKIFLHKSPSKRSFRHRIHSLQGQLMPEEALHGGIVYRIW